MGDQEGLILQGCGGEPQEWLDGINEILDQECILKKSADFEEAYTFRHDGLTCIHSPVHALTKKAVTGKGTSLAQ